MRRMMNKGIKIRMLIRRLLTPLWFLGFPVFWVAAWLFWDDYYDARYYKSSFDLASSLLLDLSGWKEVEIGESISTSIWQNELIERGYAQYNPTDAEFEWK